VTAAGSSRLAIQARIAELGEWFHNMELGGVWTAPGHFLGDYPRCKWRAFEHALPPRLDGKTVLDVGCNAGFYSLEMKRRGAARVLGIDDDESYLEQARFAAEVCGLDVEFERLSVYDVGRLGERFDLVIFMGVIYHLRYPLLALDLLREHVAHDRFLFQSMLRGSLGVEAVEDDYPLHDAAHFDAPEYPKLHFVEQRYAGDPTNWWVPNKSCVEAMLRASGFVIEANPEPEVYLCRAGARPWPEPLPFVRRGEGRP
jgi:tRNA (mo5U34)-methyltransferase